MLRLLPPVIEPDRWTLAFHKTSPYWWVRWLARGKYKHVSAFAFVAPLKLWLVYDVTLTGTRVLLLPDSAAADAWLAGHLDDADLVRMPRQPAGNISSYIFRPFYCVPAIKHLVGIRCGALLSPSGLYKHCRALEAQSHGEAAPDHDRPADPRPAAAGGRGP